MTVEIKALIAALDPEVKPWAQIGCSKVLFHRVVAGRRVTPQNATPFLKAAQERFGAEVHSIKIGGEVHFAPEAIQSLLARAESAERRAERAEFLAYRRVLTTADFRPLAN